MLENKRELCAVVVPYRIPILIRESEMWELGEERPDFVLRNMVGASIDVIVTKVERTANRAQASRRQASRSQRRFFAAREDLHAVGSRITCRMLAVGPRRCLVDCYGYDLDIWTPASSQGSQAAPSASSGSGREDCGGTTAMSRAPAT